MKAIFFLIGVFCVLGWTAENEMHAVLWFGAAVMLLIYDFVNHVQETKPKQIVLPNEYLDLVERVVDLRTESKIKHESGPFVLYVPKSTNLQAPYMPGVLSQDITLADRLLNIQGIDEIRTWNSNELKLVPRRRVYPNE